MVVSTSCSLLHVRYDVLVEYDIPGDVADRLAFAKQKVGEVVSLAKAVTHGAPEHWSRAPQVGALQAEARCASTGLRDHARISESGHRTRSDARRSSEALELPLVPATTLGSFPQTAEIRQARYEYGQGRLTADEYRQVLLRTRSNA